MDMLKKMFQKPKTKEEWPSFIMKFVLIALAIAYWVFLALGYQVLTDANEFYRSANPFSGAAVFNPWIRSGSLVFLVLSIGYAARLLIAILSIFLRKGKALATLMSSIIKYASVIVLIFMILTSFKVDATALLISAGVVSLVIGLGAQSLISDVIAGLFIVFENSFNIGDIVVIDDFRGTVSEIGVRTTKVVDWGGNIKVINNSDIKNLVNMTAELSVALVDVSIEYEESIERVEGIIKENLDSIKASIPEILEGPFYRGVSNLGASGVSLRFTATCKETARFQVERDLLRAFKLLFDEKGVGIPFDQIVVHEAAPKKESKPRKKHDDFVQEQKELAKDLPDAPNDPK